MVRNNVISKSKQAANILVYHLSKISRNENYDQEFRENVSDIQYFDLRLNSSKYYYTSFVPKRPSYANTTRTVHRNVARSQMSEVVGRATKKLQFLSRYNF